LLYPTGFPGSGGLPEALLGVVVFLIATAGLRLYINWVTNTGYTYGALAAPIAFVLAPYFFGMGVVIGAQLNNAIQEPWPHGKIRSICCAQDTAVHRWPGSLACWRPRNSPRYALVPPAGSARSLGRRLLGAHAAPDAPGLIAANSHAAMTC